MEEDQTDNHPGNQTDNQIFDWMQCICHKPGIQSDFTSFTEVSWKKLQDHAVLRQDATYQLSWSDLEGTPRGYCHRTCYQNYTDKQKLERISSKLQSDKDGSNIQGASESSTSGSSLRKRKSLTAKTSMTNFSICPQQKSDQKV